MLRKTYNKVISLSGHPHALWYLAAISFMESSFFPIPPDVLMIPMVLAAPTKAWKIAFVCTVSSVLGGLAGYGIGYFLFESIGQPVVALYGLESQFAHFKDLFNEWGAWIVFSAGFSPIPYKVFTIASGVAGPEAIPLYTFIAASILGRGARFFILAALLYKFGAPIRAFIEKYLGWLTLAACILGFGGFVAIKML